jgi:hypothetical protein
MQKKNKTTKKRKKKKKLFVFVNFKLASLGIQALGLLADRPEERLRPRGERRERAVVERDIGLTAIACVV